MGGFVLKTKMLTKSLLKTRGVAEGTQTVKMMNLHWAGTIVAMKAEKGTAESPKPAGSEKGQMGNTLTTKSTSRNPRPSDSSDALRKNWLVMAGYSADQKENI